MLYVPQPLKLVIPIVRLAGGNYAREVRYVPAAVLVLENVLLGARDIPHGKIYHVPNLPRELAKEIRLVLELGGHSKIAP